MNIPLKKISYEDLQKLSIEQRTQLFIKDSIIEDLNKQLKRLSKENNYWKRKSNELNNIINELDKLIEQYSRNDYYYKYNGKYLKSEIIKELKELKENK